MSAAPRWAAPKGAGVAAMFDFEINPPPPAAPKQTVAEALAEVPTFFSATPAPAPVLKTAPAAPVDKAALRAELLALITAATDIDVLTGAVAKRADQDTRKGELFVLRGECKNAIKTKAKELGVRLTAAMLTELIPDNKKVPAPRVPGSVDFTEAGVTERMRRKHTGAVLYTADTASWYRYDTSVWRQEPSAIRVVQLAREVIETLPKEAAMLMDPDQHDEAVKDIKGLQRVAVAKGAVEALAGERGIIALSLELDTHPELLCVANGVVNLQTGALSAPDPAHKLTMTTTCAYDPAAKAPTFMRVLHDALRGDKEVIDFLQRLMGYTLLANPVERVLVVPVGGGKNGKSTIFNAVQETLGGHAGTMASETIAGPANAPSPDPGGTREDLLKLRGKRTVFASEIKRASVYVDSTVKTLAGGGDLITARGLWKSHIDFRPTCTIISPANILAQVREDDPAVWDRLLPINFTVRFTEPDTTLPAKLRAEQSGILNWLVQGAIAYQVEGLNVPQSVQDYKARLQLGSSPISLFLEDCCVLDAEAVETTDALFASWKQNAFEQGERFTASTKIGFARTLASHGFAATRVKGVDGSHTRGFKGLRLRYTAEQRAQTGMAKGASH